jgi:hypothetical protein
VLSILGVSISERFRLPSLSDFGFSITIYIGNTGLSGIYGLFLISSLLAAYYWARGTIDG